ncbi:RagB/SusD family nutrient uptake outer membrane protein [Aridibaculum aurantiacum]|uniref:RagB/SusD family nutrient uptake outer membrane protein n=1 Tax=Aridibaculum aurantiacum TaxID=2810307 RepID=UPI001A977508|nr:RagB/SusD family nutrient uptake outer membrane protein [Aridibaculum aurantiacum]
MKKFIIRISLLCLPLFMFGGCKKFLDQEVPGAFPEQDFYKTDNDATQAVNGVYDMMQAHYNNNWASLYMIKTLLSDESNAGGNDAGDQPGYQTIDDYNFDATNDKIRDAWRMCYFTIYRANKVINRTEPTTEMRRRLIAEAKFLRAYNYFELASLWGDVPMILNDVSPSSYTSTGRTTRANVYAQVEKDLAEAIPVLPTKSTYSVADRFRVSKGSAQAMLGKALLYQQKWGEAVTQFEAVISSNQFSLEPSIGKAFSKAGEFGSESLFEISYTAERSYDWGNFPWGGAPESNIHIQLMGPRGDFYTKAPSDSLIGGWGFVLPKQKLWDAYVAAGDVNRRRQTVMSAVELIAAGGNWSNPTAYDYEGYFQRKYGSFASQTGAPISELNYGTNWRHLRYADVLLMAAEAHFRAGNEGKAREYINLVRQRSGLGIISATGNNLFQAIVTERQLELAFEGVRYTDLVRWGLAVQELGALGFRSGKHELLPIPIYDVNTGGLSQNAGY